MQPHHLSNNSRLLSFEATHQVDPSRSLEQQAPLNKRWLAAGPLIHLWGSPGLCLSLMPGWQPLEHRWVGHPQLP